ncbi:MAG: hypothetical protein AABW50_05495 [Nanoarchaeota archaeon]
MKTLIKKIKRTLGYLLIIPIGAGVVGCGEYRGDLTNEDFKTNIIEYTIQPGDRVEDFFNKETQSVNFRDRKTNLLKYMQELKKINPKIEDLDQINYNEVIKLYDLNLDGQVGKIN